MHFHNTVVLVFAALEGHVNVVRASPAGSWSQSHEGINGGPGGSKACALEARGSPPAEVVSTEVEALKLRISLANGVLAEEHGLERREAPAWMKTFNDYFTFIAGATACVGVVAWAGRRLTLRFTSEAQRTAFYACLGRTFGLTSNEARDAVHAAGEVGAELQEIV